MTPHTLTLVLSAAERAKRRGDMLAFSRLLELGEALDGWIATRP